MFLISRDSMLRQHFRLKNCYETLWLWSPCPEQIQNRRHIRATLNHFDSYGHTLHMVIYCSVQSTNGIRSRMTVITGQENKSGWKCLELEYLLQWTSSKGHRRNLSRFYSQLSIWGLREFHLSHPVHRNYYCKTCTGIASVTQLSLGRD